MVESVATAGLIAASTWAIRMVYWAQYRTTNARRRTLLVGVHFVSICVILASYCWACIRLYRPGEVLPLLYIGALMFLLGSILFFWSALVHKTSLIPDSSAGVTAVGPYRYVRHPIYAGGLLAALGLLIVVPNAWILADWIVLLGSMLWLIRSEEREVLGRLPGYAEYAATTSCLLPIPRRRKGIARA